MGNGPNGGKERAAQTAAEGFRRIAFGDVKDAVKLLFFKNPTGRSVHDLDLFSISEIRRGKDGAVELKFFDRMEALRALAELEGETDRAGELMAAIDRGAKALREARP